MIYYQFSGSPDDGAYFIRQKEGHGWTLWYLKGSHLSLHHHDTAEEVEFEDAEAVMQYCQEATDENPEWAYFKERIFHCQVKQKLPDGLGERKNWIKGEEYP